jgi:transcription-repair coupling factor (superfamily II helicase)
MLEEAVRKIKGEGERPAHAATVINLGISVRIDSDYILEENQRLRMYKRIAGAEDYATLTDIRAELQDRYGEPPESVTNLLAAAELRLQSQQLSIAQIDRKRTQVELNKVKSFVEMLHIKFVEPGNDGEGAHVVDPATLMKLISRNAKRGAQFSPQGILRWPLSSARAEDVLTETRTLLDALDTATVSA